MPRFPFHRLLEGFAGYLRKGNSATDQSSSTASTKPYLIFWMARQVLSMSVSGTGVRPRTKGFPRRRSQVTAMFIGDSSLKLETTIQLFAFTGLIHDLMGCSFVDLFEKPCDLGSQVG